MIKSTIKYRKANSKDMPLILKLINDYSGDDRKLNPDQFILACTEKIIVGCVRTVQAESDCKELASLAVLPEYRNSGIGTTLIKEILQADTSRPLYLICNKDKSGFYKKHNFKTTHINALPQTLKRDFKNMKKSDSNLIVMKLE